MTQSAYTGDGPATAGFDPDLLAAEHLAGGIPSPEMLREYEQVAPGLADRILKLAETDAQFRRDAEKSLASAIPYDRIAQLAALVVVVLFLWASVHLIDDGKQFAGCVLGVVDLIALISVFATAGRRGGGPKAGPRA